MLAALFSFTERYQDTAHPCSFLYFPPLYKPSIIDISCMTHGHGAWRCPPVTSGSVYYYTGLKLDLGLNSCEFTCTVLMYVSIFFTSFASYSCHSLINFPHHPDSN
jgi:hypothetical protein